jgi:hypothetical protein
LGSPHVRQHVNSSSTKARYPDCPNSDVRQLLLMTGKDQVVRDSPQFGKIEHCFLQLTKSGFCQPDRYVTSGVSTSIVVPQTEDLLLAVCVQDGLTEDLYCFLDIKGTGWHGQHTARHGILVRGSILCGLMKENSIWVHMMEE